MTRGELTGIANIKGYVVFETVLFGKHYAWIKDNENSWELEPIDGLSNHPQV